MLECFRKRTVKIVDEHGEILERSFLEPSNEESLSMMNKLEEMKTYQFDIKENRNYDFLKKYMKLIRFFHHNIPERLSVFIKTFEQARMALEFDVGNLEYYWTLPVSKEVFNKDEFIEMLDSSEFFDKESIVEILNLSYSTIVVPEMHSSHKSIAFEKMSHTEFEDLYKRLFDAVISILSASDESVRKELETFS